MINSNQIIKWLILDRYIELESSLILNDGFSGRQSSVGLSGSGTRLCTKRTSDIGQQLRVALNSAAPKWVVH